MSHSRRVLGVAEALALVAWASIGGFARAADPTEDDLIRKGVEARKRQEDAGALELFSKAYALHHSPRAAAQMGLAEIALGRWVDAEAHLEEALAASADAWVKKNTKTLSESLDQAQREIGALEILGPPGAEVIIGTSVKKTLPLAKPIHVRAGDVRFELHAPGYNGESHTVRVVAGQLTRETVDLTPLRPPTDAPSASAGTSPVVARPGTPGPQPAPPPASSGGGLRLAGGILSGAGVLAVGAGLTFGLKARAAGQSDSQATTFDQAADRTGHRYQLLEWVGYGVGAALIAGGAAVYIIGGRAREGAPAVSVSFLPIGGGGAGFVGGRF